MKTLFVITYLIIHSINAQSQVPAPSSFRNPKLLSVKSYPKTSNNVSAGSDFKIDSAPIINQSFQNAILKADTSLNHPCFINLSVFKNSVDFKNSEFLDAVTFQFDKFYKESDFSNVIFHKNGNFYGSHFFSDAEFGYSSGNADLVFSNVTFDSNANFSSCHSSSLLDLSSASVRGVLSLENSKLEGKLDMSGMHGGNSFVVDFANAKLPDTIDMSNLRKLFSEIDLTEANYNSVREATGIETPDSKKHYICLLNTDVSKINLDYRYFRLYFSDSSKRSIGMDEKQAVYESLLKNFKDRGELESYKQLDIEYQQFKWKTRNLPWLGSLQQAWWNFGYNKELVFWWTCKFLLVFLIINFFFLGKLNDKVFKHTGIEATPIEFKRPAAKIWKFKKYASEISKTLLIVIKLLPKRLWYSIIYTSNIFFKVSLKLETLNVKNVIGSIYICIIYVTGLVCIAYMVNYIVQK